MNTGPGGPLIALIHATMLAAGPARTACQDVIPDAQLWDLLDDRLMSDLKLEGRITPRLAARLARLVEHAALDGADAVWLTCSSYSALADAAQERWGIPIVKPDAWMYQQVVEARPRSIAVLASTPTATGPAESQLRELWDKVEVIPVLVEAAGAVAATGDADALAAALTAAAADAVRAGAQVVAVAQYSLSPAAELLQAELGVPVYTGARGAALELRAALSEKEIAR